MVKDTRGHEIPSGSASFAAITAFQALSRSISSVQTAADLPSAQALVDAMVLDGLTVEGTVWWVSAENGLFVYADDDFQHVRDNRDLPSDTGWLDVSMGAGWTAPDPVKVRQINNEVRFSGVVQNTTVDSADGYTVAFTLPVAVDPPVREESVRASTGSNTQRYGYVEVARTVRVWSTGSTSAYTRISGGYWTD